MKRKGLIAIALTVKLTLLMAGTLAWAESYRVATFYFAATGAGVYWWDSNALIDMEIIIWQSIDSYFNKPELLATLHRHQKGMSPLGDYGYSEADSTFVTTSGSTVIHEKFFLDGVGTGPTGRLEDRQNAGRPGAVRGWVKINDEARAHLGSMIARTTENIILNVVGWSRGGVSAIRFAHEVARNQDPMYDYSRVKKINILAFDPVPGWNFGDANNSGAINCEADATLLDPTHFDFTGMDKVNHYVGIYAWDERSEPFSPLMPVGISRVLTFALPGSHETMAGNTMDLGHSVRGNWDPAFWGWPWPILPPQTTTESITNVSDVSALIAMKLLASPQWGSGRFDNVARPVFADGDAFAWDDYRSIFSDTLGGSIAFRDLLLDRTGEYLQWPMVGNPDTAANSWGTYKAMRYVGFVPWIATTTPRYNADNPRQLWRPRPNAPRTECYAQFFNVGHAPLIDMVDRDPVTPGEQSNRIWLYGEIKKLTNSPPVANAGPDQAVSVNGACQAAVALNGSGSWDPDGDPLQYSWTGPFGTVTGANPTVQLGPGAHTITLNVFDGLASTADAVVVTVKDLTPPAITNVTATPRVLWPPNHKMVPVTVEVSASDNCGGKLVSKITGVRSNEPEKGLGDGDTAPDWKVTGDLTLNLRAERSGTGNGRVYTITVRCTDSAGNRDTKAVTVAVPHDRGKGTRP